MRKILLIATLFFSVILSAQERVTLLFVGDLMQHDDQIKAARTPDEYDYTDCFKHIKEEISKADLTIGNLEVTMGGKPYRGYPSFSAPDEYLKAIKEAGFDILLTANNHCLDRKKKGLERTIHSLDSLGIPYAGTYLNETERKVRYPLLVEVKGLKIAFLNYTYGTNGLEPSSPNIVNYIDKEQIRQDILKARQMHPDIIIACMHWGVEYHSLPSKAEKGLADWLLAQGVDHIIGSHPHVPQPMEIRKDSHTAGKHAVVYSLGNFISNMSKANTDGGTMVKLEFIKYPYHTQLKECKYALVWTSRPIMSGKKNFEVYPATFIEQPIRDEEFKSMNTFLDNTRQLYREHNLGVEEYLFK